MKLKKEFEDFYKDIRIDSETPVLIEKRETLEGEIKDKFPSVLDDHGIKVNKSDIRMFDQGSYKYNTTIHSDIVDRDVAVMIPLSISDNDDPRKIKGYLRDSINIYSRTVEIKEPCVRAVYHDNGEEWLGIANLLMTSAKYSICLYWEKYHVAKRKTVQKTKEKFFRFVILCLTRESIL